MIPDADREALAETIRAVARTRSFPDDPEAVRILLDWVAAVLDAGRSVNLTAARTPVDAVRVLVLSALAVARAWPGDAAPPRRIVDLGTGNGLPGVAAAVAWPRAEVILLERRRRKAEAVESCRRRVGLDRVRIVCADGRDLLREEPRLAGSVDLVTVRAVGSLAATTAVAAPWVAAGGRLVHWKGAGLRREERRDGERAARAHGLEPGPGATFDDPAGPAHLVVYGRPPSAD